MKDRMIEVARFAQATEAEMLMNLLKSEGVDCYVRDGLSSNVIYGSALGNIVEAKVELLEKDVPQALDIMREYNYAIPDSILAFMEDEARLQNAGYAESEHLRKQKLSRKLSIVILVIIAMVILLILLNKVK
ncbi:MAG: DUF2007 domain-containing protein [Tannerella sp.]|jgi:hypothetical protein|nr:DUF2007 domain-containing protein [Tannerella sp.]